MNALVKQQFGLPSTRFAQFPVADDLGAGIEASFGLMKYKGKVWTTSYKGEERALMRADGDGPRNSIDVVIVKSARVKAKIYYAKGYVDGSTEAPDCFSTNGIIPDPAAAHKQAAACVSCPMNVFGSRTTEAGKKAKACSDSKRTAIVPADPAQPNPVVLRNEVFGGPMLLRIPAATLGTLAAYSDRLKAAGYPYQSVITRIAFDPAEAYPTFTFQEVRPLTDEEADVVLELAGSPLVERILSEEVAVVVPALPAPAVSFAAPLPGQSITPQVMPPAPPPAAPAVVPAPAPALAPAPAASGGFGPSAPTGNSPPPHPGPAPAPAPAPAAAGGFGPSAPAAAAPVAAQPAPVAVPAALAPGFEAELDALLKQ